MMPPPERGTVVCFHAHPDDEVITTGGTIARAVAEGHRVVLVFATRGELGEVPDDLAPGESLAERRTAEAARAAVILGVSRVEYLGYRDSGMADESTNDDTDAFWRADPEEAAERLAAILRSEAAAVATIYDPIGGYRHPDHIQTHRVGLRATEIARTPRVYEATADRDHFLEQIRAVRKSLGEEQAFAMPEPEEFADNFSAATEITTRVDVRPYLSVKRAALVAHSSQVPDSSFFLAMPEAVFDVAFGTEWFIRRDVPKGTQETWLFPPD
jgi:LmbE family N-acetylglucosaminyl deacetylase